MSRIGKQPVIIPAGAEVPGTQAYRARPGKAFPAVKAHLKIGGAEQTVAVPEGATNVKLKVNLKPGNDELWGKFSDAKGNECGAYYAYVTKL